MNPVKKMLMKFNGLYYPQEYLCLAKESFQHSLHVYLVHENRIIQNVTEDHLFVGYSPLVLAFSSITLHSEPVVIDLVFSHSLLQPNENLKRKDAIGRLSLKKIHEFNTNENKIFFYKGTKGHHHFTSGFHQFIMELNNNLFNKKDGNVFLKDNLYKQIQIAYSIPRKICLITVGENNLYNLFPTDLHGRIGDHYIISLRHEGKASQQVESMKRIVLSDMEVSSYKKVYGLGKNHMQPLKDRSSFDFTSATSKNFNLPLPIDLISYKELEWKNSFIYSIHKLMLFRIVYEEKVNDKAETLAHIHNCYATWRHKQGISSNFLLR